MAKIEALKGVYLFDQLNSAELEKVAAIAEEKSFASGQEIFSANQVADALYVIRMGAIKIYSNSDEGEDHSIAHLASGSHFGEVSFADGGKRSATAQAVEPCHLIEIKYSHLSQLLNSDDKIAHKFYKSLSLFIAKRLRATLGDLNQARDAKLKHF